MNRTTCFLLCKNHSHGPIELLDGQPVCIGRSKVTGITDSQLSRSQVELTADCKARTVIVRQVGVQPSSVNGVLLESGEINTLGSGGSLCLIAGKYKYTVHFQEMKAAKKRTANCTKSGSSPPQKKKKADQTEKLQNEKEDSGSDDEKSKEVTAKLELLRKQHGGEPKIKSASASAGASNSQCTPASVAIWKQKDTLLTYTGCGVCPSAKIAAFDIDGTIIGTKSGRVFPTSTSDWKILLPEIPGRLKQLVADGFKIVFMSNQMGIGKKTVSVEDFKKKVENIIAKLNIPVQVFISTGSGPYRKPGLGMLNALKDEENCGIALNSDESFYVGDAAGRPKNWAPGKKKDFSCSDRLFAKNAGLTFHTPEEFFLKHKKAKFELPSFDPSAVDFNIPLMSPETTQLPLGIQEVIVLVGNPASGKSHFFKTHLAKSQYVHVNRDTLHTWQKCVQATKDALANGSSVAVDNTNPDVESRKRYVDVAKAAGVACRCFVMSTSVEHARHNERFREMTDNKHEPISGMVFNMYKSKYQEPTLAEGFSEIVRVNFVPKFKNLKEEALYKQFLSEK